jgi:hypothetical protein
MPATKPISMGSYFFGVFVGASVAFAIGLADAFTKGNSDAAFGIVLLPFFWLLPAGVGLVPFLLLRKVAPSHVLARFVFIIIFLVPTISFACLLLAGLSVINEHWAMIIMITYIGGLACWICDQIGLLLPLGTFRIFAGLVDRSVPSMLLRDPELIVNFPAVSDNHPRLDRYVRRKARYLTVGGLMALILPMLLLLTCNQFLVEYRAENIAGDRPYCILLTSDAASPIYETATQRSQLSFTRMRGRYGSRGGYFTSNHAILVLDDPREFLNWSYRAENFVRDPVLKVHVDKPCVPQRHFAAMLN